MKKMQDAGLFEKWTLQGLLDELDTIEKSKSPKCGRRSEKSLGSIRIFMPNRAGVSLVIIYGNAGQKQKDTYAELGAKFPSQFPEIPDEIEKLLRIE